MDPFKAIVKILEIIDYKKDKNLFATHFIDLCIKQAFLDVVDTIPKDRLSELETRVAHIKDLQEYRLLLRSYIDPKLVEVSIEKTTSELFQDYIETILPTLSIESKDKLLDFIEVLGQRN